jgi:hypothetical protein
MSTIYDFSVADAHGNSKAPAQYQGKLILNELIIGACLRHYSA